MIEFKLNKQINWEKSENNFHVSFISNEKKQTWKRGHCVNENNW
jgi:hypothetical protein